MTAVPRTQIRSFHLDAPRARVVPLFTARGEREWAPGWDPTILSGAEERGSAFRPARVMAKKPPGSSSTTNPSEGRASYARLAHDSNIGLVDVLCTEARDGGTDVSVRYTLTPLHAGAEAFVSDFSIRSITRK